MILCDVEDLVLGVSMMAPPRGGRKQEGRKGCGVEVEVSMHACVQGCSDRDRKGGREDGWKEGREGWKLWCTTVVWTIRKGDPLDELAGRGGFLWRVPLESV